MIDNIICPNCKKPIQISQALRKQIEEEVNKDLMEKHLEEITQIKKQTEDTVRQKLEDQIKLERDDLEKQLAEKEQKLTEFREEELKLREEKRKLVERGKEMELEVARRIDSERKKVEEEVLKKSVEEHRLKDKEKDKVIDDLKKALEDAQRKASQGSQQLQGEVLELDIENMLKDMFPHDQILPVEKGTSGADIKQIVKSPQKGLPCGTILWELKRTKAWSDSWTKKLKEDLRFAKANIPVIVSVALPQEAKNGLGLKDGVWVCSFTFVIPLSILLRNNLLDIARQKLISSHKGNKAELLYSYITGHEFKQQVEALVEVYQEMNEQIQKERASFEKSWKAREMQIRRLVFSTANIYGGMQGLIGSSLPQVKGLDFMELDSGEE